jgi:hypothetical protein
MLRPGSQYRRALAHALPEISHRLRALAFLSGHLPFGLAGLNSVGSASLASAWAWALPGYIAVSASGLVWRFLWYQHRGHRLGQILG